MKFFETQMGQKFFTLQLPQLIGALQEIAAGLKQPVAVDRLPELGASDEETDILSDIYDFEYIPESQIYSESDPLNGETKKAMNALLGTLSPEQKELFLQYEAAENARGSNISRCAFKDGVRLAVQIFMAGCQFRPQEQ